MSNSFMRFALLGAVFSATACGASPDPTPQNDNGGEELGRVGQAVQLNASGHYQLDMTNASQVEGFIFYRARDGAYYSKCGVTFVSKHFGITAGHCVKDLRRDSDNTADPGDDTFIVAQADARNIIGANGGAAQAYNKIVNQGVVTGTWPDWNHGPSLTCSDGLCYSMLDPQCRVRWRCGGEGAPNDGCPSSVAGLDLAAIHCPNRSATLPWATVATGDAVLNQQIDVHWYHEILLMPSSVNEGTQEMRDHYMALPDGTVASRLNNYHYVSTAQLFPLISQTFPTGEHYRVTDTSATTTFKTLSTDAYSCHGTSGSGVFFAGTQVLLGPVIGGGSNQLLCTDPAAHTAAANLNWSVNIAPQATRVLESFVVWDR